MRKFLFIAILTVLFAVSANAQTTIIPVVGGIATIDASTCPSIAGPVACSFQITLTNNTTLSIINARGSIDIFFVENGVGGWTVTWPSTVVSPPTITATASATTLVSIKFNSNLGQWYVTSGGAGSASAGSPGCRPGSTTCIDPTAAAYGAKFDAQAVFDASVSNGATTVSCPNSDCNFVSGDTGKACYGVDISGVYTFGNSLGVFTFVSAQSGTCVTGTGADIGSVGNLTFAWGTNDTTAIINATTALYALPHCGVFQMPSGRTILTSAVSANWAPVACTAQTGAGYNYSGMRGSINIQGQGRQATFIYPAPGFNFTNCGAGKGCFWGGSGSTFMNFTIDGLGASLAGLPSCGGAGCPLFAPGSVTGGRVSDVYLFNWAYSATDTPTGIALGGQSIPTSNIEVAFFGAGAGRINCGLNTALLATYAAGGLTVSNNIICEDVDGAYGNSTTANVDSILVAAGGQLQAYGMYSQQGGTNSDAINVGGILYSNECTFNVSPASVSAIGIKMNGGTAYLRDTLVSGGSTAGAISGTGTVVNEGGNCHSFALSPCTPSTGGPMTFTGTYIDQTGTFPGAACTGVATAASTLGLYGTGPNVVLTTCTSALIGSGILMPKAGTISELLVTATAAGVNASSGLVTVIKNGADQTMVCTIGTGTACTDGVVAHQVTVAKGDLISIKFTSQALDTLAGVKASLIIW